MKFLVVLAILHKEELKIRLICTTTNGRIGCSSSILIFYFQQMFFAKFYLFPESHRPVVTKNSSSWRRKSPPPCQYRTCLMSPNQTFGSFADSSESFRCVYSQPEVVCVSLKVEGDTGVLPPRPESPNMCAQRISTLKSI